MGLEDVSWQEEARDALLSGAVYTPEITVADPCRRERSIVEPISIDSGQEHRGTV
jgi:hypothetical protein